MKVDRVYGELPDERERRRYGDRAVQADAVGRAAVHEGAVGEDGIGDAVADDSGVADEVLDVADGDGGRRWAGW